MGLPSQAVIAALHVVPRPLLRKISQRYIAGERLEEAIERCRDLGERGFATILDILGEDSRTEEDARRAVESYLEALAARCDAGLNAHLSIKPTQLGLRLGDSICERGYRRILEAAEPAGVFVRVEMEDHTTTSRTLKIFERLRRDHERVGIVIQSCLRRSLDDVRDLLAGAGRGRLDVRLVKGIYVEPHSLAYRDAHLVRENFRRVLDLLLAGGAFVGVGTHDERVVFDALEIVDRLGLGAGEYEFQMLLGVMESLRDLLRGQGQPVRIYVPFGPQWRAYSLRRLRRNPAILRHVIFQALHLKG